MPLLVLVARPLSTAVFAKYCLESQLPCGLQRPQSRVCGPLLFQTLHVSSLPRLGSSVINSFYSHLPKVPASDV